MTKKHFKFMAEIIKNNNWSKEEKEALLKFSVNVGMEFNPRFNINKFKNACGPIGEILV